jgi:hypothetical protein
MYLARFSEVKLTLLSDSVRARRDDFGILPDDDAPEIGLPYET